MTEFEEIQRLIRLKRHEKPPEGFVDQFVSEFQQRQRSEMLHRSARGLLWERMTTYFSELFNPKWALAGAAVCAVAVAGWMMRDTPAPAGQDVAIHAKPQAGKAEVQNVATYTGTSATPDDLAKLQRYLLKNHFEGGFGSEPKSGTGPLPAGFHPDLNGAPFQLR